MKNFTFDPVSGFILLVSILGLSSGAQHATTNAVTECERIDQGGYFTFADPTCAAGFAPTQDGDSAREGVVTDVWQ